MSLGAAPVLPAIKAAHTLVWALLATCVVAIPVASYAGQHALAVSLAVIVALEVAVLALNHGRCPLTALAARHTLSRADNFDIYLPVWLARHNKLIFGSIYLVGTAFALVHWALAPV